MNAGVCRWMVVMLMAASMMMGAGNTFAQDFDPDANERAVRDMLASAQDAIADGRHEEALLSVASVRLMSALTPRELGMALYLRGQAGYALGNVREAMADWQRALDEGALAAPYADAIHQSLTQLEAYLADDAFGGSTGVAYSLFVRGREAMAQEDPAAAADFATRALSWLESDADSWLERSTLILLAAAARAAGRIDEALEAARRMADMPVDEERNSFNYIATVALLATDVERADEAELALGRMLELAERYGDELTDDELSRIEYVSSSLGIQAVFTNEHADTVRHFSNALKFSPYTRDEGRPIDEPTFDRRAMMLSNIAVAAQSLGNDDEVVRRLAQLRDEAVQHGHLSTAVTAAELAGENAGAEGGEEAACVFNALAYELQVLAGKPDDAEELRFALEATGCPGFAGTPDHD